MSSMGGVWIFSGQPNGLVERHNAVIGETMNKTLEDTKCSLKVSLAWTLHAKNNLSNAHGFSPFILVFGSNPKLPSVLRWSETKNLKISIPDNIFFLYLIIIKLCTLKQLENIRQKLKLIFS